jgi:hypothetical protein
MADMGIFRAANNTTTYNTRFMYHRRTVEREKISSSNKNTQPALNLAKIKQNFNFPMPNKIAGKGER